MLPRGGQCHSTLKTFLRWENGLVHFNVVNIDVLPWFSAIHFNVSIDVLPWFSESPESTVRWWNSDLSSGSFWDLLRLNWVVVWVAETMLAVAEAMLAVFMLWLSLSDSGKKTSINLQCTFLWENLKPWIWTPQMRSFTIGRDKVVSFFCGNWSSNDAPMWHHFACSLKKGRWLLREAFWSEGESFVGWISLPPLPHSGQFCKKNYFRVLDNLYSSAFLGQ